MLRNGTYGRGSVTSMFLIPSQGDSDYLESLRRCVVEWFEPVLGFPSRVLSSAPSACKSCLNFPNTTSDMQPINHSKHPCPDPPDTSAVQVVPNCPLQSGSTFTKHLRQVLQVVTSRQPKSSNKVLCGPLQVPIIFFTCQIVLRSAEICVA